MPDKHSPSHVSDFIRDAGNLFPDEADSFHLCYQIVCPCQGTRFRIFLSNCWTVIALCDRCGRSVTIYDLAYYPAASKPKRPEEFRQVLHPSGDGALAVFVMYEYGELDDDQSFDRNDIAWCRIWVEDSKGSRVVILDDESA